MLYSGCRGVVRMFLRPARSIREAFGGHSHCSFRISSQKISGDLDLPWIPRKSNDVVGRVSNLDQSEPNSLLIFSILIFGASVIQGL